ncbi:MAG: TRAP transporter substrate-binding protein DctP [Desulfosarcina sp.]|nr:TRAP transporter substrate-binding protein DctP [Desulfobacterales bacterium]
MAGKYFLRLMAIVLVMAISVPAQAVVLKIATLSPDGSSWMRKMREGAEKVAQATDQRVRFKFYPGGVMGNNMAVLRKIRVGQLQGGAFSGGILSGYYSDVQVYSLPMIFKSLDEVDYVRKRMDPIIIEGLAENGFVSFGLADGGFAYVMSSEPVDNVDALKELKVWVPAHDKMVMRAMKGFGINPISLPIADVRTGLQTGLIDTVAISPVGAIVLQWHTQVKYLTKLPLVYLYGILAVERKAFARIAPADQAVVHRIMGQVWREMDTMNRRDNAKALEALQAQGIKFVEPSPEASADWYKRTDAINRKIIDAGLISPAVIDKLEGHLNDYRSRLARESQ